MAENPSWPVVEVYRDTQDPQRADWPNGFAHPTGIRVPGRCEYERYLPASVLQQAVEVFEQRAKQDRHDNEREAYMNAADYLRNLLSDEGSGPEVGRCMACGQFIKGGGVMCGECGRDEDRKNVGL